MLRSHLRSASLALLLTLGLGLVGVSCQNRAGDCNETLTCAGSGGVDATGGNDATGGTAPGGQGGLGGQGGQGGEGGAPPGSGGSAPCDPVEEQCAGEVIVHVSPLGSDDADGSVTAPLQTLGEALARVAEVVAAGEPAPLVYACASEGPYEETLSLTAEHGAVGIYGGFDCELFVAGEDRAVIVAEEASGHRIEGATGVTLGDLQLESPDASAAGASSVALSVVSSTGVRLLRSDLIAGEGAAGADGMGYAVAAQAGEPGNEGTNACVAGADETNPGGPAAVTSCGGVATASVGGKGGPGGGGLLPSAGVSGDPGEPDGGTVGVGESGSACMNGGNGDPGTAGSHGPQSDELGALDASGYTPPIGGNGTPGGLGEGGGGGGGAAKPASCDTGASGGSGGGGGCPGAPATGGQGGGGSFGLISVSSQVELSEVSVSVAVGGEGGAGGDGQLGGDPGPGADGGTPGASEGNDACGGGNGGRGGRGGSGAGGAGGPSIGVAYVGPAPLGLADVVPDLPSSPAAGGTGGVLHTVPGEGPNGVVMASWGP